MPTYKQTDAVQSGRIMLPRGRYQLRITSAVAGVSKSSNNPQITLEAEMIGKDGETVLTLADGSKIDISGVNLMTWVTISEKNLANVFDFFKRIGKPKESLDTEHLPEYANELLGLCVDAICYSTKEVDKDASGEVIRYPDGTVKEKIQHKLSLNDILGVSATQGAGSF